jgi:hypothetical protein
MLKAPGTDDRMAPHVTGPGLIRQCLLSGSALSFTGRLRIDLART